MGRIAAVSLTLVALGGCSVGDDDDGGAAIGDDAGGGAAGTVLEDNAGAPGGTAPAAATEDRQSVAPKT
jgi:hypothetical protein